MSIIDWDNKTFLLDLDIMDGTHREFVDMVNRLSDSDDNEFAALFDELISHTKLHFRQEEQLMSESGFPAYAEHRDEHQRILGEFRQFKKRVDHGLVFFGRNYIDERMPEWFSLHAATMDSALAAHIKSGVLDITGS